MTSFCQQAVADKLKAELEASRKAEANPPKPPKRQKKAKEEKEEEEEQVIVLTKTTSKGIVRPLGEEGLAPSGEGGGKRKKKRKMATHDKDGQRERYFADDDRMELKDLVKQEKMGTAEDSNMMYARLVGRVRFLTDY